MKLKGYLRNGRKYLQIVNLIRAESEYIKRIKIHTTQETLKNLVEK